jgi:hypothetical protein
LVRVDHYSRNAGASEHGGRGRTGKPAANDRNIRVSHRETPAFEPHHCAGKGK